MNFCGNMFSKLAHSIVEWRNSEFKQSKSFISYVFSFILKNVYREKYKMSFNEFHASVPNFI